MLKNYWRHRVVGGTTFIFLAPEAPLGTQQPSSHGAMDPWSSPAVAAVPAVAAGVELCAREPLWGWQSALRFNLNKKGISHFAAAVAVGVGVGVESGAAVRAGDGD